ncbi:AMP-binding protein [Rubrobacter taiwanensis]|uniref:AMP-binding protein n=1 Tax=Rubrobacter taiwanensis TaxID=185139 RepID=UPI001A9DDB7F|nr:AMP-binding protein [Rubrobacter taiwanensis]
MGELLTLKSLVGDLASDRPAIAALQKEDAEFWTYAELAGRARRLAGGLAETGVGRGDRVALLADNRPEWIASCLAVIEAGAVIVPLDVNLEDEDLSYALNDSEAGTIFTTAEQAGRLGRLKLDRAPEPVLLDAGPDDERSWQRLMADEAPERTGLGPDDPAALFYTSGTTGRAKGVPLSHGNLAYQLNTLRDADLVTEEDRVLLPLPLHHVYPFVVGMLTPLALGLTIVMPYALTGPQLVRAMREGEVSVVIGVPRLYSALYSGIEDRLRSGNPLAAGAFRAGVGLSAGLRRRTGLNPGRLLMRPLHRRFGPKLRVLASGGAALDPDVGWKLEGLGWQVGIGYGLTETSPLLTLNPPGTLKLESAGRPVPGTEVRLDPSAVPGREGEEARAAGPHREGEILARGPGVFEGYRNMPEETGEVFTEDGWFRTGDLGYFDEDGFLYITGRASTLIVTEGGKNVQPEEVEEVYLESPYIREIGVLEDGGRLAALIVPEMREVRRRGEVEEVIREAVAERSRHLPAYQRISDYAITGRPLEYTQLGKLRRHILEERYEQAKWGEEAGEAPVPVEEMSREDRELLENPAARQVWNWLADRYPDRRLEPETHLHLDLGIDSLEWVNLTMEIGQRTGVELEEEAIERVETVRDLLREVAEAGETRDIASPLKNPEQVLDGRQKRLLRPLSPVEAALARGMFALNRAVARGPFALRVEGRERLPEEGPFIIAPNHVSYLDAFAVAAALDHRHLRRTYWGGWVGAAFGNPVNRFISRLAQVVPVDPHRAGTSSLAFSAAVLERGKNLVWFPEGRRSPTGELQPFKPGVGMLLEHFRVPVVPVFIRGTREAMPQGQILPRPHPVTVVFGEPLEPDELERQGEGDRPQDRITSALRERVAELGRR